jgi:hypothetical protein
MPAAHMWNKWAMVQGLLEEQQQLAFLHQQQAPVEATTWSRNASVAATVSR